MPISPHSSSAFASPEPAHCRIGWRPSAIACGALIALGLLAACSILASDLARGCAWPTALAAPAWGAWLARREWRRAPLALCWRADGVLFVGDHRVDSADLQWRGRLAFLAWRDDRGNRHRLAWWPDTLSEAGRRELRLAAMAAEAARRQARVAP